MSKCPTHDFKVPAKLDGCIPVEYNGHRRTKVRFNQLTGLVYDEYGNKIGKGKLRDNTTVLEVELIDSKE